MIGAALLCCAMPTVETESSTCLVKLQKQISGGRDTAKVAAFWREVRSTGTPLIEKIPGEPDRMRVTFLWRGPASATAPRIFGVFNTRPWTDGDPMRHLAGTDIWYRTYQMPAALRAPYSFIGPRAKYPMLKFQRVWEGETRHDLLLDPLNRHRVADVYFRRLSFDNLLTGPDAPPLTWKSGVPLHGKIVSIRLRVTPSGQPRRILVYRPSTASDAPPPGVVVAFDGLSYRTPGMLPEILDSMIAAGRIPPTAAIMIDSGPLERRAIELNADPAFERFVAERVMPLARARFGLTSDPHRTIVAGASRGGLAAASIARRYPQIFGNVIAQSAAFWSAPQRKDHASDWIAREYLKSSGSLPVRFHVAPGSMEDRRDMLEPNRRFRDMLRARGYRVCYREFVGGHTFVNWRDDLVVALAAMTRPWTSSDPCQDAGYSTVNARAHSTPASTP